MLTPVGRSPMTENEEKQEKRHPKPRKKSGEPAEPFIFTLARVDQERKKKQ